MIREATDKGIVEIGHLRSFNIVSRLFNGPKLRALTKEQLSHTSDSGECQRAIQWPIYLNKESGTT